MGDKILPDELDLEIATATESAPTFSLDSECLQEAAGYLATASGLCSDPGLDVNSSIRLAVEMAIEGLRAIYSKPTKEK